MTPRERVLTALDHQERDRVPIDLGSCGPTGIHALAYERLLRVLGTEEQIRLWDTIGQLAEPSEAVLERIGADVQWGAEWQRAQGATCYAITSHPLADATPENLATYTWPDGSGHILQRAQMLRGFDTFLVDLMVRRALAEEIMDRIAEVEVGIISSFLEAVGPYLDVFAFKDDLATQGGPLNAPELFRCLIKPRMAKLIEAVGARTKAKI